MRTSLIIPTRNASSHLARLLPALRMQTLQPDEMLVVDSASSDDTVARFREFGARVEVIDARDFNHGGTRRGKRKCYICSLCQGRADNRKAFAQRNRGILQRRKAVWHMHCR